MKSIIQASGMALLLVGSLKPACAQLTSPPDQVYAVVEKMPRFKSTDSTSAALVDYLGRSMRYPAEALMARATGRVFVSFVVNQEGDVEQVNVVKGMHPALNEEAVRVVSDMPRWETPGRQLGQPVKVSFTVPITFNMRIASAVESQGLIAQAQRKHQAQVLGELADAQAQLAAGNAGSHDQAPVFDADPVGAVNYLNRQVQYPLEAKRARKEGVVLMAFTVDAAGGVTNVRVTKGVSPALDAEAVRVVSAMPRWKPGTHEGQPVSTPFSNVPVGFHLR